MNRINFFRKVILISLIAVGGGLLLAKAAHSQDSPRLIMRGPHGAFHIVEDHDSGMLQSSDTMTLPKLKSTDTSSMSTVGNVPIVIMKGPHGAAHLVTEMGVGGPEGSGVYLGFPTLEIRGSHGASHIVSD